MTVGELVAKLQAMPQDAEARVEVDTGMSVGYLHVYDVMPTRVGIVLIDCDSECAR